ncbi:diguanylate cyclase [Corallococcus macrosporus]|uniref:diguanylate cyclase n=1 Tax=Corallococcus macrosporus TaxID=35 RepID=UPI0009E49612|nr:diguanylate cyclase [Corallococcus macrosporus]
MSGRTLLFLGGCAARPGARWRRQGAGGGLPGRVALLAVDPFKKVNDRYGHLAGDGVLMWLGRLLGARCRREDVRGRWGGEESVVGLLGEDAGSASEVLGCTAAELAAMAFDGDKRGVSLRLYGSSKMSRPRDVSTT